MQVKGQTKEQLLERAKFEMNTLKTLTHDNIVKYIEDI